MESGVTVLDDSYNANPQSMLAALNTLSDWPCAGRRIAILADMLELGAVAEGCHYEIGECAATKVDCLVGMGEWGATIIQGAQDMIAAGNGKDGKTGEDSALLQCCCDHNEIVQWLQKNLAAGDCVLIKGSRGMHMEQVVQKILPQLADR